MKLSLQKVLNAWVSIKNIEKEKASPHFAYGIAKNKGLLQNDVDGLSSAEKEMWEIDKVRFKYCEDHAERDTSGKPIIEKENGVDAFKGINKNDPEFISILDKINKLKSDYEALLKTETEINFHMIAFEEIPKEISPNDFENLSIMISEPKDGK